MVGQKTPLRKEERFGKPYCNSYELGGKSSGFADGSIKSVQEMGGEAGFSIKKSRKSQVRTPSVDSYTSEKSSLSGKKVKRQNKFAANCTPHVDLHVTDDVTNFGLLKSAETFSVSCRNFLWPPNTKVDTAHRGRQAFAATKGITKKDFPGGSDLHVQQAVANGYEANDSNTLHAALDHTPSRVRDANKTPYRTKANHRLKKRLFDSTRDRLCSGLR